jgi:hypothetical protein
MDDELDPRAVEEEDVDDVEHVEDAEDVVENEEDVEDAGDAGEESGEEGEENKVEVVFEEEMDADDGTNSRDADEGRLASRTGRLRSSARPMSRSWPLHDGARPSCPRASSSTSCRDRPGGARTATLRPE